jgi:hypothetical protein
MPYICKRGVRPVEETIAEVQATAAAISREIQGVA